MATKKQQLSREYNWFMFRVAGRMASFGPFPHKRRLPLQLRQSLAEVNLAQSRLRETLKDPAMRRAYYRLNGA